MRILMVTPMLPRRQGAGAIPVLLYAELTGLIGRHEVTLVTVVEPEAPAKDAIRDLQRMGVRLYALPQAMPAGWSRWSRRWRLATMWLRGKYPWRTVWFWDPAIQRILGELGSEDAFDVVQVEDNAMGAYRYPIRAPVVLTEYEVRRPRPIAWRGPKNGNRSRWFIKELDWQRWTSYQAWVWRRFDRVQVLSSRDAAAVQSIAPDLAERVRVNPFPVEIPPLPQRPSGDGKSVVFVGNFNHPPNVDAALWLGREIMPLLQRQSPGVRLAIIGPDPPAEVHSLAGPDIVVTAGVPQVEPFIEEAAVVMAPVRIGGGQRMKVLQAMAMGKAVVTTARGAEGLSTGSVEAPLAIADNAEGIARATAALLDSAEARTVLGARARAHAMAQFSPSAYVGRLEMVYAELLAEKVTDRSG
ncbi:MAG: glycosyltransferase [Chloroflexi bacterium]|nr:glycosyltransferase [Chloroflexota bacterium]